MNEPDLRAARQGACSPASASVTGDVANPAAALAEQLGKDLFAQVFVFASPDLDLGILTRTLRRHCPGAVIAGCSTAGEIGSNGYAQGSVVAFALPVAGFETETVLIENIDRLNARRLIERLVHSRQALARRAGTMEQEFAILMADGLSGQEDALVAAIAGGLGPMPVFGGSAGDGERFRNAQVSLDGRVSERAAIVTLVRSSCPVRIFSLDHMRPSKQRMVVTRADTAARAALRINDEPAAREYARQLGMTVSELTSFTFASRPLLVQAGGRHHARAIREVGPDESLIFFAVIDEGLILTLSEPQDMAAHLESELTRLSRPVPPTAILGFDCIFRRIEAEGRQKSREVSEILAHHNVRGFSTYGEQIGAMHVNQTLTGIAFYPPEQEA
ncbi:GfdT protein [Thioclava sp. SK-1]|uniref:FIST N-terminal domain-containing protein n=1 Tax=Thioclava sp. SK-1 TaxID=1889770 RepID=UPI0008266D0D|nr:FIST N-terminal domain-containing protein [Thioclava sp. SK-1]OCX63190.1 GfdT protein [Thioclava sp. SK-1]